MYINKVEICKWKNLFGNIKTDWENNLDFDNAVGNFVPHIRSAIMIVFTNVNWFLFCLLMRLFYWIYVCFFIEYILCTYCELEANTVA